MSGSSPASAAVQSTGGFAQVPIAAIRPSATNPRTHVENAKFLELVASVTTHGVLQPILLRPDPHAKDGAWRYRIVAGERRWRAANAAGLERVPAVISDLSDDEVLEIQLIENLQRDDLSALEQARGYRTLLDRNPAKYSAAGIATRLGLSEKWVWDRMKLLDLLPEAQQLLEQDRIGVGHAILIARLKPEDQKRVIHPKTGGLFEDEGAGFDFDVDDAPTTGKPGKYDSLKPVSVRELGGWIAHHIRFDVEHMAKAAPLEFAPTAQAVEAAAALPGRGKKVVPITHDWTCPANAKDDTERTYGSTEWKRADGQEKSKTCEHRVLGVIAAGPGYGQSFDVCIARDKCDVHWKQSSLAAKAKQQKARTTGSTKKDPYAAQLASEQRAAEERAKRDARWKVFQPALAKAVHAAAATLRSGKLPGRVFAQVLKDHDLPATTTVASLPYTLLTDSLEDRFDGHPWHGDEPKMVAWAKLLGVDAKAIEREVLKPGPIAGSGKKRDATKPARKAGKKR